MRRFTYLRMTGDEYKKALNDIGMKRDAFSRIFGVDKRTSSRWASDDFTIPPWVPIVLAILQNCPGAIVEARAAAAEMINTDTQRPGIPFPFRQEQTNATD